MKSIRNRMNAIALTTLALAMIIASVSYYRTAKNAATHAIDAHAQCLKLVRDIEGFRSAPRIASLEFEPPDRIAARVTKAAGDSQVSPASIVSVDPQAAVRIGRTEYQQRATQIALQNASLEKIAGFVTGLEELSEGMAVRDLSLNRSPSEGDNGEELWNVRLTLTQMIFSPISGK